MKNASLLPSMDLVMTGPQDPSILTASKSMGPGTLKGDDVLLGTSWWLQVALAAGLGLSLWWFLTA